MPHFWIAPSWTSSYSVFLLISPSRLACLSLSFVSSVEHLVLSLFTRPCWNRRFPGILHAGQNSLFRTVTPGPRAGSQSGEPFLTLHNHPWPWASEQPASASLPRSFPVAAGQCSGSTLESKGVWGNWTWELHQQARRPRSEQRFIFFSRSKSF